MLVPGHECIAGNEANRLTGQKKKVSPDHLLPERKGQTMGNKTNNHCTGRT